MPRPDARSSGVRPASFCRRRQDAFAIRGGALIRGTESRAYSLLQSLNFFSDTLGRLALTDPQEVGDTASRLICSCLHYGESLVVFEPDAKGQQVVAHRGRETGFDPPPELGSYLLGIVEAPQVVRCDALPAEPGRAAREMAGEPGYLLCTPLRGRISDEEQKLGVLVAARPPANGQAEIDLQALDTLGGFVSTALVSCAVHQGVNAHLKQRRRVEAELRRSRDRLELITLITKGLSREATSVDIIERIVDGLYSVFPLFRTSYATFDANGLLTYLLSRQPSDMPGVEGLSLDLGGAPKYVEALRGSEPVIVEDVRRDSRLSVLAEKLGESRTRAVLDMPLWNSARLSGVLRFECAEPRRWSAHEASTLLEESEFLSLALKNAHDRAERDKAQESSRQLEAQLFQAQKMQAIGRLAGGVAHDFNNILMAMSGYTEEILGEIGADDPLYPSAVAIMEATERASGLTRQLLQFSRRRLVKPESIDLNRVVVRIEKLLRSMIGEDVRLGTVMSDSLPSVWVDVSQIEQILMNLAVNARDALPDGGKLTISTDEVTIGPSQVGMAPGLVPGHYAVLSVTDDGVGMRPEVREQMFEPFFTTKPKGKGTGLGLATVYGIVSQSHGAINVMSEPGCGTTVQVYLPVSSQPRAEDPAAEPLPDPRSNGETVLLVEDDPAICNLLQRSLMSRGYRVLSANGGDRALEIVREQLAEIDLLITDVVMPGLNGRELVEALAELDAEIPVIYISGFTDNVMGRSIDPSVYFLQKPFALSTLAHKIREVLDAEKNAVG